MITTINEFKNNLNESITFSLEDLKDLGYNSKAEFNDKIKQEVKDMMKHTSGLRASECKKEVLKTFQDELKSIQKKKEKTNESVNTEEEERNNLEELLYVGDFEI